MLALRLEKELEARVAKVAAAKGSNKSAVVRFAVDDDPHLRRPPGGERPRQHTVVRLPQPARPVRFPNMGGSAWAVSAYDKTAEFRQCPGHSLDNPGNRASWIDSVSWA